jgi:hypothetical protein
MSLLFRIHAHKATYHSVVVCIHGLEPLLDFQQLLGRAVLGQQLARRLLHRVGLQRKFMWTSKCIHLIEPPPSFPNDFTMFRRQTRPANDYVIAFSLANHIHWRIPRGKWQLISSFNPGSLRSMYVLKPALRVTLGHIPMYSWETGFEGQIEI